MKSGRTLLLFLVLALAGCGGGSGGSGSGASSGGGGTPPPSAENVLAVTVNGSLCSGNSYPNKPCVSVTVCSPGTTNCQTINDILLDTASYGLRIFKQALGVSLPQESVNSGPLAECVQYGDGTSHWGPVSMAGVILGNEPVVQVPIHVVDATYGTAPAGCRNADRSPAEAGFNGILGVGFFAQDCGPVCASSGANGLYYTCAGSACSGTSVPLTNQVQNPAALLPQDNNGVIVRFPGVSPGGLLSVNGSLIFGIGTRTNNAPSAVKTYTANQFGELTTTFGSISYGSFFDTGSNGLFFPSPSASVLPDCAPPNSGWYCPPATTAFSATNVPVSGSPGTVSFQIGNFATLINSSNRAFSEIGGSEFGGFDWGLPFYFGRDVYMGFEGKGSSLGNGLYWAY
ncbi:MAG: DUF3443 domain-containing protein [Nitrospirae bacterium]|nr:DUF3443 domain-containing protein [Nitrospirota bacterium]